MKALPTEFLAAEPAIPWTQIARMRDHARRYVDTSHAIIQHTVDHALPELDAVASLIDESAQHQTE